MKKFTQEELDQILTDHRLWLDSDGIGGKRADLQRADLRQANLQRADLRRANLQEAGLRWANLSEADLRGACLRGACLHGAWLQRADLRGATLPLSIRDCYSFHCAKFSPEALPWLILHPRWSEWKDTVQIAAG